MDVISSREFYDLCHQSKTIKFGNEEIPHKKIPKVLEKEGTIIKIFYPKRRLWSSDKIRPYAKRFCENILSLRSQGYDVPIVTNIQYCADLKLYLVYYQKIEGHDIRHLARQGEIKIIEKVVELIVNLHKKGIFFRSIHLENLLYKPNGELALLDITDVRFKSKALTIYSRYRNLKHLLKEPKDKALWEAFGFNHFLTDYLQSAALSPLSKKILLFALKWTISQKKRLSFSS